MKKLLIVISILILFASCSNIKIQNLSNTDKPTYMYKVSGYSVEQFIFNIDPNAAYQKRASDEAYIVITNKNWLGEYKWKY